MENKILSVTSKLDVEVSYQCYAYAGLIEGPITLLLRSNVAKYAIDNVAVGLWGFKASDVVIIQDNVDDFRDNAGRVALTNKERLNLCVVSDADDLNHLPILYYDSQGSDMLTSVRRAISQADYQKKKMAYEF